MGFSIIELLVAIIIIGILVAVLLPIISNRAEQARIARAQSDIQNIAESMERVSIDTGYYVRLVALNDVLIGDGVAFNRSLPADPVDTVDGLTDYLQTPDFIQFPDDNSLFIDPSTGDFAVTTRTSVIQRLLEGESRYDGGIQWGGPYVNWPKDRNTYDNVVARDGVPDDPWGNDYLFFTRVGLFLEPDGRLVTGGAGVSIRAGGGFNFGGGYPTQVFDRPAIVSLGPNGLPGGGNIGAPITNQRPGDANGDDFGDADDYYRLFGR